MARINKLDTVTANGIAAGEVVERPASVIKELCENSLDAEASIIQIDCQNGGISYMKICDNGVGMDATDALEAFERHATSKLSNLEDLEKLYSFGFRGEALAAISSVSKIRLKTKEKNSEAGTEVYIEGGELLEHLPCSTQTGTCFEIKDLFYNTPARYKFLKKDKTEAAKITEIVQRMALARPDVSFRLNHGRQNVVHTPGNNDLYSCIYAIFGKEISENTIYAKSAEVHPSGLNIEAYLGLPLCAKKSRNNQLFYVNDRLMKSTMLGKAVEQAYTGYLMHGQHPFAILKLNIPANLIDVNVHPQKMEIRFWDEQVVFRAVYHLVRNALDIKMRHPEDDESLHIAKQSCDDRQLAISGSEGSQDRNLVISGSEDSQDRQLEKISGQDSGDDYGEYRQADIVHDYWKLAENRAEELVQTDVDDNVIGDSLDLDSLQNNIVLAEKSDKELKHIVEEYDDKAQFIGGDGLTLTERLLRAELKTVLFNTFIVLEYKSHIYLIDQHAAHERILYEHFVEAYHKDELHSQELLVPLLIQLSPSEMSVIQTETDFINSLGYDFSVYSQTEVLLRTVPVALGKNSIEENFLLAMEHLLSHGSSDKQAVSLEQNLHHFATRACKAAVKAHDVLAKEEIEALLIDLNKLKNPYQCPHGRPVIVQMSLAEIEKMFKRIV